MIDLILGATVVPVLQNMEWTDQIGWLVEPWTKRIEVGEGQFKDLIIPVAKYVTINDCDTVNANLKALMTDKGYRSLILISAEGDMTSSIAENIPMRKAINIEQEFSINVWMNNHQGATHLAEADIMKAFYRATFKNTPVPWEGNSELYDIYINKLRITFVREINGNPFKEYSFASDQAQFANTYSAFGMVFKITGLVFPNCLPAYPDLIHDNCNDQNISDMLAQSGTYTPVASAIVNLDALPTMTQAQYMRVGNTVTVSGRFTADPTEGGIPTSFEITIPIASNFGAIEDCAGVNSNFNGEVIASVANNTAVIKFLAQGTAGVSWSYTFTYQVI